MKPEAALDVSMSQTLLLWIHERLLHCMTAIHVFNDGICPGQQSLLRLSGGLTLLLHVRLLMSGISNICIDGARPALWAHPSNPKWRRSGRCGALRRGCRPA